MYFQIILVIILFIPMLLGIIFNFDILIIFSAVCYSVIVIYLLISILKDYLSFEK